MLQEISADLSDGLSMTIDTTAPAAPLITTDIALTNINTPTITGTTAPGTKVTLLDGDNALGTVIAGNDGSFSITSSVLVDADYTLTVTATDAAGNTSVPSTGLPITIDTTAPAAPVITTSGSISSKTPAISGTAEAGSTVSLFIDGADTGVTVQADETGAYTVVPTSDLTEGIHTFTISATDAAGNTSSNSVDIDVDTLIEPPVITTSGSISSKTPAIRGTAEAGSTVSLFIDGADTGVKVQADQTTGAYTVVPTSDLTEGIHTFTISATDAAGNTSSNSVDIDVEYINRATCHNNFWIYQQQNSSDRRNSRSRKHRKFIY